MSQNQRWKSTSVCFLFGMIMFNGYDFLFSSGVFTAHDSVKQFTPQCLPNITKPQILQQAFGGFSWGIPQAHLLLKITTPPKEINNWEPECLHPGRLTWNLRIHPWKRKIIFQCPSCSSSMLIFQGVHPFFWTENFSKAQGGKPIIFGPRFDSWSKSNRPWGAPTTHCVAGRTCSGFKAAWVPESQGGNPPTPRVCEVHVWLGSHHLYKQVETTTMWPAPKGDFLSHKIGTFFHKAWKMPTREIGLSIINLHVGEVFFTELLCLDGSTRISWSWSPPHHP